MRYKVHFPQLAFQKVNPEDPMVPVGDPVIVKKGGDVPEWAAPATVSALINSGMILPIAEQVFEPVAEIPALANPEVPPFMGGAITPDADTPAERVSVETGVGAPPVTRSPEPVAKPKDSDAKPLWEAYAESIGIPRAEAESLTKPKLQDRVAAQERARAAA